MARPSRSDGLRIKDEGFHCLPSSDTLRCLVATPLPNQLPCGQLRIKADRGEDRQGDGQADRKRPVLSRIILNREQTPRLASNSINKQDY